MKIYKVIEKKETFITECNWYFYSKEDAFAFIDIQKQRSNIGEYFVVSEVINTESRE